MRAGATYGRRKCLSRLRLRALSL
ncbi:hypothetical protein MPC4_190071 [Methylocella tundrae]|uniref:Uncharacterized protein n=1 Tax=Methylocella tundrae TaxID=227605 RepID=A0A4U8YVH8_METTU|nr:protein of unknown function [Methylocella tundrae]VTZ49758.1 hypothetical protein MPC4_190071 [Methylocella tundrae]